MEINYQSIDWQIKKKPIPTYENSHCFVKPTAEHGKNTPRMDSHRDILERWLLKEGFTKGCTHYFIGVDIDMKRISAAQKILEAIGKTVITTKNLDEHSITAWTK